MKTKYMGAIVMLAGIFAGGIVFAQTAAPANAGGPNIQYPVAALGNCGSKDACRTYCNDSSHVNACLTFAEENNLMSPDEVAAARKFIAAGSVGPGGCTSPEACKAYCNDISHINECVSFAEKTGILPPDQLAEAKKVQAAIARGIQPPPCGGEDACKIYCSEPSHMEACITFAEAAGMMTPQDSQNADKMLAAIKKGVYPPPCNGPDACNAYCAEADHVNQCTAFAVAAGMMTPQEAEMAQKTGGKGPGGCIGREQCNAFCNNPDNQQACFNFAKNNGLIPAADLQQMEQAQKMNEQAIENAPKAVINCLSAALGSSVLQQIKDGQIMPSQSIGAAMRQCFSENHPQGGPTPPSGTMPGEQFTSGTIPNMPPGGGEFPQSRGYGPASGTFQNMPPYPQGQIPAGGPQCEPGAPCNQGSMPPCPSGQNCGNFQGNGFTTGTGPMPFPPNGMLSPSGSQQQPPQGSYPYNGQMPPIQSGTPSFPPPATSSPSSFRGGPEQANILSVFGSFIKNLISSGH